MLHVSTQKLIVKLCELTAQGDVQWREGDDGAAVFETEGYAVEIAGQPARLRVLNSDGSELERVEADSLTAAPWPNGEGSFADRVSTMAAQAKRLTRGTDHAISRILSSLSAPPTAASTADPSPEIETDDADPSPLAGGPESEAAMAAAVADMESRLRQTPLEQASNTPSASVVEATPAEPKVAAAEAPEAPTQSAPAAVEHFKRSPEMFGRTRSFAIAGRTHHRQSQDARPISSLGKITASGLLMTGAPTASGQPPEIQPEEPEAATVEPTPAPAEVAPVATPRAAPAPASPDAYKPWV